MHRVDLPPADKSDEHGELLRERYSLPYFFSADHETVVEVLPSCVTADRPLKYEPIKYSEYSEYLSKYTYEGEANGDTNGEAIAVS